MTCVVLKNNETEVHRDLNVNACLNTLSKSIHGDTHVVVVTVITKKDFADEVAYVLEQNYVNDPVVEYIARRARETSSGC